MLAHVELLQTAHQVRLIFWQHSTQKETHMLLVHLTRGDGVSAALGVRLVLVRERVVAVGADAMVALLRDLLVLLPQQVRLRAQHPRHADEREQEQEHLERRLARVQLVFLEHLGSDARVRTALGMKFE